MKLTHLDSIQLFITNSFQAFVAIALAFIATTLAMPYPMPYPFALPDDAYHPAPDYHPAIGRVKIQVSIVFFILIPNIAIKYLGEKQEFPRKIGSEILDFSC